MVMRGRASERASEREREREIPRCSLPPSLPPSLSLSLCLSASLSLSLSLSPYQRRTAWNMPRWLTLRVTSLMSTGASRFDLK